MNYTYIAFFLAYIALTLRSVHEAAKPGSLCGKHAGAPCFRPLLKEGDAVSMVISAQLPIQSNATASQQLRFTPICQFDLTVPKLRWHYGSMQGNETSLPGLGSSANADMNMNTNTNATANTNTNMNTNATANTNTNATASGSNPSPTSIQCNVSIPDAIRRRSSNDQSTMKPWMTRITFRLDDGTVLNQIAFDLTKITERKSSAGMLGGNPTHVDMIPYLKYGREWIHVRWVAEYRPYGSYHRNDGIALQMSNATTYRPAVYIDEKAVRHSTMIEIGESGDGKPPIPLRIRLTAISPQLDSINIQIIEALRMMESMLGATSELDEIRYFLSDDKLYRFFITQVISYVHLWLDYVAFRDEVQFYRGKRSMKGVSVSSVVSKFVCSFIIFLYLLDGGGTSWLVLVSIGSSCLAEGWKVQKVLQPRFQWRWPWLQTKPWVNSKEDGDIFDRIAVLNLAMAFYPAVIGWAIYSYQEHDYKSWWSWLISNLANAVYTFGFISMCPQLYVNYRLKSVAHLPWKVFVYKMFNTFVDDAFAFLIDMPWKHRLMTLRDDVVFLLLLVQVYLYRVDKTRTNEYGYAYEGEEKQEQERGKALAGQAAASTAAKTEVQAETTPWASLQVDNPTTTENKKKKDD